MVDVAVVGAGAAGIGAAQALRSLGLATAVVEARARPGGRGHTVDLGGHPADLGCEWLHGAESNPWTAIAEGLALPIDRREPDWAERFGAHQLPPDERAGLSRACARFWSALEAAEGGPDRPVSDVLPRDEARWLPTFDAVTSFLSGAGIGEMSAVDAARYGEDGSNWRPVAGYGALVASQADGLDVAYETPVTAIDLTGPRVALETGRGRLEARAVILTASVGVLKAGAIRVTPRLPDDLAAGLDGLDMGNVAKLFLATEGELAPELGRDAMVMGSFDRARTGSYTLNPLGRPMVQGYFGGDLALELERAGPEAMAAFALDELAGILGNDARARLRPMASSSWAGDPWALGAYAFARPGGADGRSTLSRPVLDRLFLAGEACSPRAYGTAHGAYLSGAAAARAAASALAAEPGIRAGRWGKQGLGEQR